MANNYTLPLISIITPSFNQGQYLEKCIDSILSQHYPNLEYIIMDGGSTDGSVEIIRKYEKQLTYWQSQPDEGHYSAVNQGLNRATGDILCWLNSDDMFHPDGLFKVAAFFSSHPEIEFITGKRVGFDAEGNLFSFGHEQDTWCRERLLDPGNIDRSLFVMQEATFWRRSLWERAGGCLDRSYDLAADFELWCRFSRYARLYTADALLAGYRYYGIEQRSWKHREEYVAQCKAIIERERSIAAAIPELDSDAPPPLQADHSAGIIEIIMKKSLPAISIVTPSFNQAPYLEECIDSILSQNYPNLEYIIMDGGSSDGSVDIIKKYEKHLTYWQSQPDGGQYNAVNDGFKRTSGAIMAWLNSDDKYHRDTFFKVAYLFDSSPGVEWLAGHPTFWGKDGGFTHMEPAFPVYCRKDFLEGRYNQPFIQQESTFWKRSLWERAGGCLRTDLDYAGDLELWIRFFRHALLYSTDTFLGGYRGHGNQKASLFMDRYVAEAEAVIENEKRLRAELYAVMSPDAPTPLALDLQGYKAYLGRLDSLHGSPKLMAATEEVLQYLLMTNYSNLAVVKSRDELLELANTNVAQLQELTNANAAQINALEYSLSWRITRPLRWLGDKISEL